MEREKNKKKLSKIDKIILSISVVLIILASYAIVTHGPHRPLDYEYPGVPAGQWKNVTADGAYSGNLTFGVFTKNVYPEEITILVTINGSSGGNLTILGNNETNVQTVIWDDGPIGAEAFYFDYFIDGNITTGDYIYLTGLLPTTTYEFEVFDLVYEERISMTGDDAEFTTDQ